MSSRREITKTLAVTSSSHGLPKALNSKRRDCRVFWGVAFFGCLGMFTYQVALVISKFQAKQTSVGITLSNDQLPFPAVTICNLNPYRISKIKLVPELAALLSIFETGSAGINSRRKREAIQTEGQTGNTGNIYAIQSTESQQNSTSPSAIVGTAHSEALTASTTEMIKDERVLTRQKRSHPCQAIPSITGVSITYDSPTYNYLSYAHFTCTLSGFVLAGPASTRCYPSLTWECGLPQCCLVTDTCPAFTVEKGTVSYSSSDTLKAGGSTATVTCDAIYTLDPIVNSVCNTISCCSTWSKTVTCERSCDEAPGFQNMTKSYPGAKAHGTYVQYTCDDSGYVPSPYTTRSCSSGMWVGEFTDLTCIPGPCGSYAISGGSITYTDSTRHNSTRTVTCINGYYIVGSALSVCQFRVWTNNMPTCNSNDICAAFTVTNANPSTIPQTAHGSTATITCATGYDSVGSTTLSCSYGIFDVTAGTCKPGPCIPTLNQPTNGAGPTYSDVPNYFSGSTASFSCNVGYSIVGSAVLTCLAKAWDAAEPTCSPNPCSPIFGAVTNGNAIVYSSPTYESGSTASFSCITGYSINGTATSTCTAETWSSVEPTCSPSSCAAFTVANGNPSSIPLTAHGSQASIMCATGYDAVGSTVLSCSFEKFDVIAGTCEPGPCTPTLVQPTNGAGPIYSDVSNYLSGSTASFSCDVGYIMVGSAVVTCSAKSWDSAGPTCAHPSCGTGIVHWYPQRGFGGNDVAHISMTDYRMCPGYCANISGSVGGTYVVAHARCYCKWALPEEVQIQQDDNNASLTCNGISMCGAMQNITRYTVDTETECDDINNKAYFGDFNGDGICDGMCRNKQTLELRWAIGAKILMFSKPSIGEFVGVFCVASSKIQVRDVDGDGTDDLVCMATNQTMFSNSNGPNASLSIISPLPATCSSITDLPAEISVGYTDEDRLPGSVALFSCAYTNGSYVVTPSSSICETDGTWRQPYPTECIMLSSDAVKQLGSLQETFKEAGNNSVALQQTVVDSFAYFGANVDPLELRSIGHTKNELVQYCTKSSEPCLDDDFEIGTDPTLNNCYIYHNQKDVKHVSQRSGQSDGLTLRLFVNQSEYMPTTDKAGVQIVVHAQQQTVIAESMGQRIPMGFETFISVRMMKITRLSAPYGDCTENGDGYDNYYATEYSVEGCLQSCYQRLLIASCNCGDPRLPVPSSAGHCNANKRDCVDKFTNDKASSDRLSKECRCPQRCRSVRFDLSISSAAWPSAFAMIQGCSGDNETIFESCRQQFRNNNGIVHVYYANLNYGSLEEVSSYDFVNVLSDIGSQLGLWMGMSVITCIEFIAFIINFVSSCLYKK